MSIYNLDKIFSPSSIAIIGASERKGTVGYSLVKNMLDAGFTGAIYPVNPGRDVVQGLKSYPSLTDIQKPVDLAILSIPLEEALPVIRECVEMGVGGAIIISAGGKETGREGKELEARIKAAAIEGGLRILGPNCLGIVAAPSKINASFAGLMPMKGKLAFVSQSGAICTAILDMSHQEHIGFRYFVSIGSMLDVDFADLINYLGNDPEVSSIVLYIENLTNTRKFMSAARAISRVKPIVALKAGKSTAGARAASSHTGAMAGEDAVYSTAFSRAGIVRVDTIEELFDCAQLMAKQPPPLGPKIGIITNGGGPGVMAADALSDYGQEPAELDADMKKRLDEFLPPFWSGGNPIDILGDASPERWKRTLEVCLSGSAIHGWVLIFVPQTLSDAATVAEAVVEVLQCKSHPPVFAVWMGGQNVEKGRDILNTAGIPTYETPERAIKAFHYMYYYKRNLEMLKQIPPKSTQNHRFDQAAARAVIEKALAKGDHYLAETEAKAVLQAYGIPVNITEAAESAEDAVRVAEGIGYPVVMKINSRDITHKSDINGVHLNLRDAQDVRESFSRMMSSARTYAAGAEIAGVTIQAMVKRPDYELILGSKLDSDFGPVILFGMGGIMTEILKDQAIALPPLNRLLARRLMENTRIYKILQGYRNRPAANLALIEALLIRLSQLVTDFPEIAELDINPLILSGDQAWAVDARVIVKPALQKSPHHLAISPYPDQYEMTTLTKSGVRLLVRPIKPEDAPSLVELFNSLSRQSVYYRFFTHLRSLPPDMLASFTQIDYDRDMVLAAFDVSQEEEKKMLGVANLISYPPGGNKSEFYVLVADAWHGKGIGATLMQKLIDIGKERGMESMYGLVLAENTTMLKMIGKLGFKASWHSGENCYDVIMNFAPDPAGNESAAA